MADDFDGFNLSQRANIAFDPTSAAADCGRAGKVFNDPVHGHIYLSGLACDVIDTPQYVVGSSLGLRVATPANSHGLFAGSSGCET